MPVETLQQVEYSSLPQSNEIQIIPGLGRNSRLEGTGFNLAQEAERFFENFNQNLRAGKTPEGALAITTQETEVNIRTFIVEYVQAGAVLPNPSRIGQVNGVNRMVGDNGVLVVDGTSAQERNGSVLWAVGMVDRVVSCVEPGQVAVVNNPKGWTGFVDKTGMPIKYKNNMTMVHWVDEVGQLQNLTIVSDLDQPQSRRLSLDLEVEEEDLGGETEEERVTNIVRNPALLFFPEFSVNPAEYVLDRILSIRGNSDFRLEQEDGIVEYRSVTDIRRQIQDPAQLLKFNQDCEDYLLILKQFILGKVDSLSNPNTQMEIAEGIERIILNITLDYIQNLPPNSDSIKYPVKRKESGIDAQIWQGKSDFYEFDRAAAFLRTRAGCNGGGGVGSAKSGRISVGSVLSGSSTNTENSSGICEVCKKINGDNHYHCENCHKEYVDETNVASENRTKQCSCGAEFGC